MRTTWMKRSLVAVVAASVALSASACTGTASRAGTAATVNGTAISSQSVVDEAVDGYIPLQVEQARAQAQQGNAPSAAFWTQTAADAKSGRVPSSVTAQVLNDRVNQSLVEQALAKRKIKVGASDTQQVESYLEQNQTQLSPSYRKIIVKRLAEQQALAVSLVGGSSATRESVTQLVLSQPDRWICVSFVQTKTEADAAKVLDEVKNGADFGKIVAETSSAPTGADRVGGTVACTLIGSDSLPQQIQDAVKNLKVGELSAPVVFAPGEVIVFRRDALTAANAPQPQQVLEVEYTTLLARLAAEAKVVVNPQFGVWKPYNQKTDGLQPSGQPVVRDGRYAVVPVNPQVAQQPPVTTTTLKVPLQLAPQPSP